MNLHRNRAICVLGMHRSGTSAIARAVNLLGPYIGCEQHLMQPIEGDNPHGFWEHLSVYSLHQRLLSSLSHTWDSIVPLPNDWWKQPRISTYREELRRIIKEEFDGRKLWMWKDPRTSLLLPLWKDVLDELAIDVVYLICVRNPLDVAASLRRRNNFSKGKSLSLWLLYNLSCCYWTNNAKRLVLHYDDLLENWEPSLKRVSMTFGIPWPKDDAAFRKAVSDFLRPDCRHSRSDRESLVHDTNVAEPVRLLYNLFMKSRGEKKLIDSKEFSKEIAEQYRSYCTYVTMSATAQNDGYARAAREREIEKWRSRADQANADRDAVQRALLRKNEELLQHLHQGHQKDITITDRAPELPRLRTIEGGVSMKIGSPSSAKASSVVRCEAPEGGEPSERRAEFFENFSLSDMRPLEFPAADEPLVSIILPVFNKWRYTYHCLKSILESTTAATPYEVIIADDRSTDETAAMLSRLKGAHIVTNASTLGFLKNCNAAANQAKGAHLLFLNSDTEVGADWLLRLTEVMKNESVGAVGAKLIFPNGTLQEAGCIVWSDGTTAGYGRGENPCKPEFCYLRDVDYCSGACLLVRKDLFFGLGGFDETYAPAYYEDADLCFAIRNAGYRVVYQPRSEVVHHETVSTILDDAVQLSSENRAQFVRKWSHLLAGHAASRPGNILLARDSARGLRVLVVGDAIPGATTLLRRLSELRCRVSFLSFTHVRAHQPGMTEFQMMGIEMLCGEGIDVKRLMEERKGFYDVIIVSRRHDDARLLMELRRRFHTVRIIYDAGAFYDLGEMNTRRFDGPVPAGDKRREMLEAEIKLLGHADLVIVASENERDHMEALGCDNVVVWSGSTDAKTPQRLRDDLRQIIEGQDKETAGPSRQEENGFGQEVQPLPQEAFNADIAIGKASPTLRAGSAVYVPARVGNVSPVSWPAHRLRDGSSAISLSYHWLHADGTEALHDGDRTGLPCEVNPGEEIPMTAEVKVPDRPGKYILVFDMLQERVAWFEEKGSKTVRLEITVT